MQLIIISGRSGSGKTVVLRTLEDQGIFTVDNLPLSLLPNLLKIVHLNPIAVSIDSRNLYQSNINFSQLLQQLADNNIDYQILYLDATDQILLQRFSETRRKHPLTNNTISLQEAIKKEQELLTAISSKANFIIDTSTLNIHQLQQLIKERADSIKNTTNKVQILIQSFGFKYGLPPDADFVFDVRFLPNPYWIGELKDYTGLDHKVQAYLNSHNITATTVKDLAEFLKKWLQNFSLENRSYINISIGCTGGKHRSVFIAENIANLLRNSGISIQVRHRELEN